MFANPHNDEFEQNEQDGEENEGVQEMPKHLIVKVDELTPHSRKVFARLKVVEMGEPQTISGRDGGPSRMVTEARVADETGSVLMTLWEEEIGALDDGNTFELHNGYVGLNRGFLRLYVGRYGKVYPSEEPLEEVNTALDLSELEYREERSGFGGRGGRGGDRRGGRSGDRRGGGRGGDRRGGDRRGGRGGDRRGGDRRGGGRRHDRR